MPQEVSVSYQAVKSKVYRLIDSLVVGEKNESEVQESIRRWWALIHPADRPIAQKYLLMVLGRSATALDAMGDALLASVGGSEPIQASLAHAQIAKPVVALFVEHPVPAQGVRRGRVAGKFAARLVALFLRVDVIGRIAMERDLRDNGRVTLVVKRFCAEISLDPDLRQAVAKLDVIARLAPLRAVGQHISAFGLHQRIGCATASTHR